MVARLEGDDGGEAAGVGAARRGQLRERVHFGVRGAGPAVPALGHTNAVLVEQHAAHLRVAAGDGAVRRERERVAHRLLEVGHPVPLVPRRLREGSVDPRARRARSCFLPSGLSPSVPEFHRINRVRLSPPAARGLSPPVRTLTDPGARVLLSTSV
jgi:hypothetical protein